jgi:hypothetical protein
VAVETKLPRQFRRRQRVEEAVPTRRSLCLGCMRRRLLAASRLYVLSTLVTL